MYSHIKPSTRYNQVEGLYERFMDEDKIMLVPITEINKRQGGLPYERYKNYMNATTMKEAIVLGATHEDLVLNYTADYMIFINEDEVVKNRYVKSPPRARKRLNGVSKVLPNEITIDTNKPYEPTCMKLVKTGCKSKQEKKVDYYESYKSQGELLKSHLIRIKELEMRLKNQQDRNTDYMNEIKKLKEQKQSNLDKKVKEKLVNEWEKKNEKIKELEKENKFLKKEVDKISAVKISHKKLEEKVIVLEKVAQVKDTKQLKLDYDKLKSDYHDCVTHWEEDIKEKDTYKSQFSLFENMLEQEKIKNKKLKEEKDNYHRLFLQKVNEIVSMNGRNDKELKEDIKKLQEKNKKLEVRNEKVISEAERVIDLYKIKVKKLKEKPQKKMRKNERNSCEYEKDEIIQDLTMKISRLEKKIKKK